MFSIKSNCFNRSVISFVLYFLGLNTYVFEFVRDIRFTTEIFIGIIVNAFSRSFPNGKGRLVYRLSIRAIAIRYLNIGTSILRLAASKSKSIFARAYGLKTLYCSVTYYEGEKKSRDTTFYSSDQRAL